MSRIVGFGDVNKKDDKDKKQEFFAGGLDQRGGGSGLAVEGPPRRGAPPDKTVFGGVVQRAMNDQADPKAISGDAVTITMYRNGFTVDNGPLRDPNLPENKRFIEALEKGQVPSELQKPKPIGSQGETLDVRLEDKREEDYIPPAYVAFGGQAASLGTTKSSQETDAFVFSDEVLGTPQVADAARPSTTVQIKIQNGKPLRLNVTGSGSMFTLSSGFPPVDIVDPTQTIAEAGLIGASINHKAM